MALSVIQVLAFFSFSVGLGTSYKIIFVPFPHSSHYTELRGMALELQKRGHEITFFSPSFTRDDILKNKFKYIGFEAETFGNTEEASRYRLTHSDMGAGAAKMFTDVCDKQITPQNLKALTKEKYDLTVVDTIPQLFCNYLIAHHIGAPFVSSVVNPNYFLARIPSLPILPFHIFPGGVPLNMTFTKRFMNLFVTAYYELYKLPYTVDMEPYRKYVSFSSPTKLAEKSAAWLFQQDFLLQLVYAYPPHVVHVGGQSTKPANALPQEYKKIMDSAKHGVIVLSFGSSFSFLTEEMVIKLSSVFEQLPQTVIMRLEGKEVKLMSSKVVVRKWLPQNDMLAHPNVKLFITHSGNNGQFEALFHGVPMLAFHICCDQHFNAARVVKRGYGLRADIHDFTSAEILEKIDTIIGTPRYAANIKKASKIYRKQRHAILRAADTIEQVARGDFAPLYPTVAYKLNFVQFYNLDIIAALIFVLVILPLFLLYTCIRCICCRKKKPTQKQKKA